MDYVKINKVKDKIRESGLSASNELQESINTKIETLIIDSIERAKANRRNTVLKRDI